MEHYRTTGEWRCQHTQKVSVYVFLFYYRVQSEIDAQTGIENWKEPLKLLKSIGLGIEGCKTIWASGAKKLSGLLWLNFSRAKNSLAKLLSPTGAEKGLLISAHWRWFSLENFKANWSLKGLTSIGAQKNEY